MKNRINIETDGINAYARIDVNASKVGIWVLICLIFLELLIFINLFSQMEVSELKAMVFPVLLAVILFMFFPIKYLLWNLYGKEHLIINSKSISWWYDYGLLKTKLNTVKIDRLGTGYEKIRSTEDGVLGRLIFYNYNVENNLPEVIYQTTVLVSLNEIAEFDNEINRIFLQEFFVENGFIPFSLN